LNEEIETTMPVHKSTLQRIETQSLRSVKAETSTHTQEEALLKRDLRGAVTDCEPVLNVLCEETKLLFLDNCCDISLQNTITFM
jgi:hypothetical protein